MIRHKCNASEYEFYFIFYTVWQWKGFLVLCSVFTLFGFCYQFDLVGMALVGHGVEGGSLSGLGRLKNEVYFGNGSLN